MKTEPIPPSIYIPLKDIEDRINDPSVPQIGYWHPSPDSTESMTITGGGGTPLTIEVELNRTYVEAQRLRAALEAAGFDFTMDQGVLGESGDSRQAST